MVTLVINVFWIKLTSKFHHAILGRRFCTCVLNRSRSSFLVLHRALFATAEYTTMKAVSLR